MGTSCARRGVDLQHGDVLVAGDAHRLGVVLGVAEGDLLRVRVLHDVVVRDDVAAVVPDEAGAGARRHLEDVAGPEVHLLDLGGDERDRALGVLEEVDGVPLLGIEVRPARRRAGPGRRRAPPRGTAARARAPAGGRSRRRGRAGRPARGCPGRRGAIGFSWMPYHRSCRPVRELGPSAHIRMAVTHAAEGLRLRGAATASPRKGRGAPEPASPGPRGSGSAPARRPAAEAARAHRLRAHRTDPGRPRDRVRGRVGRGGDLEPQDRRLRPLVLLPQGRAGPGPRGRLEDGRAAHPVPPAGRDEGAGPRPAARLPAARRVPDLRPGPRAPRQGLAPAGLRGAEGEAGEGRASSTRRGSARCRCSPAGSAS